MNTTRVLSLSLAVSVASTGSAIIIRHDKEDQLYRGLAGNAKYASVGLIE